MSFIPVRILAIAPYEGLNIAINQAAQDFPGIETDIYTGDLSEGEAIFRSMRDKSYDAVISRGGTAELIRSQSELPVVEIRISARDVLRAMRLADNYTDNYVIIGFPGMTETAHTVCGILGKNTEIITIHSEEEVSAALKSLQSKGIRTILCDNIAHTYARNAGMNAFLITSGDESIHDALAQAENLGAIQRKLRGENLLLRRMIETEQGCTAIISRDGTPLICVPSPPEKELLTLMQSHLEDINRMSGEARFYHNHAGALFAVTARGIQHEGETAYLFSCQPTQIPLKAGRFGIRSLSRAECEHLYANSFFSISARGELDNKLTALARSRQCVMIIGETGTGKQQVAHALYLRNPMNRKPFIIVDCSLMDERSWSYLMGHSSSPLNAAGLTVYFQHIEALPKERWLELRATMKDTAVYRRERIIFSCDCPEGEYPESVSALIADLGCITLHLPTLRSRRDEIASLATLYLDSVNTELGRQLSGFEPGALRLMEKYDWPSNYTQFKLMIHEAAALTSSAYIRADTAADVISSQRTASRHNTGKAVAPSPELTLEQLTNEAVRCAMKKNHNNQSAAARQLGISRTTLWRLLNKLESQDG